jgi:FkbM family methyltransferase
MLEDLVRNAATAAGLYVGKLPLPNSIEQHLKILFARLGINCVLDVGAHYGEYAGRLREHGFAGHIVSFEPMAESYAILVGQRAHDPMWRGHKMALGAEGGSRDINILSGTDMNSFLMPNAYGHQRFASSTEVQRTEAVAVARLDEILPDLVKHVPSPRIFMKLDTQGFDLKVLEGAAGVLDQIAAIQTEVSVKSLYEGTLSFPETIARLNAMGFELTGLFPVSRDLDALRLVEIDCVLLRAASGR